MRRRTASLIVLGALAVPAAGVALATPPSGLTSQLLARGGAGELRIHDHATGVHMHARRPIDVAVVQATLKPGGFTGWHRHPGHSIVVVKTGAVTMYEPGRRHRHDHGEAAGRRGRCSAQTFSAGSAFVHPSGEHNFVNETSVDTEFYVVYLVPAGAAPLLTDVPTPPSKCT
jgi:hypothetical protein